MPTSLDPDDPARVAEFLAQMAKAALPIVPITGGKRFVRLIRNHHRDLLGSGTGPSRYSDPRAGAIPDEHLFRVLYAARNLRTAFEETLLRDRTTANHGLFPVSRVELERWKGGFVRTIRVLRLVDLRDTSGKWRSVGPSIDEIKGESQRVARYYSLAFHDHPSSPDGIVYTSRYTGLPNIAIYDRAVPTGLAAETVRPLLDYDLTPIFTRLGLLAAGPAKHFAP